MLKDSVGLVGVTNGNITDVDAIGVINGVFFEGVKIQDLTLDELNEFSSILIEAFVNFNTYQSENGYNADVNASAELAATMITMADQELADRYSKMIMH